jgi:hypothetical protein
VGVERLVDFLWVVLYSMKKIRGASSMSGVTMREQLHRQIDRLPDDLVAQIVDFTLFVMARRQIVPEYTDWDDDQWQEFALGQFYREKEGEVEYSLKDAQEIYHP